MTGIMQMFVGGSFAPAITCNTYTTAGTYTWVAPAGVTSISYVMIGAGGAGGPTGFGGSGPCCLIIYVGGGGGGGGGLAYRNSYSVTPGNSYTVVLSSTGTTYFNNVSCGYVNAGGAGGNTYTSPGSQGTYGGSVTAGYDGGQGGNQAQTYCFSTPSGKGRSPACPTCNHHRILG